MIENINKMDLDTKPFAMEIAANRKFIFSYAYKLCGDQTDTDDLVSETIFRAFKYQSSFKPSSNIKGWLTVIAYSIFVNDYRLKKYKKKRIENYLPNTTDQNMGYSNLSMEYIYGMINHLPEYFRQVMVLWLDGLSLRQISKELSVPLGTVKSRLYHGRRILIHALKDSE